jgi:hypothetical protein
MAQAVLRSTSRCVSCGDCWEAEGSGRVDGDELLARLRLNYGGAAGMMIHKEYNTD